MPFPNVQLIFFKFLKKIFKEYVTEIYISLLMIKISIENFSNCKISTLSNLKLYYTILIRHFRKRIQLLLNIQTNIE